MLPKQNATGRLTTSTTQRTCKSVNVRLFLFLMFNMYVNFTTAEHMSSPLSVVNALGFPITFRNVLGKLRALTIDNKGDMFDVPLQQYFEQKCDVVSPLCALKYLTETSNKLCKNY